MMNNLIDNLRFYSYFLREFVSRYAYEILRIIYIVFLYVTIWIVLFAGIKLLMQMLLNVKFTNLDTLICLFALSSIGLLCSSVYAYRVKKKDLRAILKASMINLDEDVRKNEGYINPIDPLRDEFTVEHYVSSPDVHTTNGALIDFILRSKDLNKLKWSVCAGNQIDWQITYVDIRIESQFSSRSNLLVSPEIREFNVTVTEYDFVTKKASIHFKRINSDDLHTDS